MLVTLLHDASCQLRRLRTACFQWARDVREWWLLQRRREERGRKLLREWLSREQLALYEARGYFEVIGCQTGKRYRIYRGNGNNIIELDDAALPSTGWCFVPCDPLVVTDVMLAQKIALETDEQGALAVAVNFTPS
jgi:hypothetical protein